MKQIHTITSLLFIIFCSFLALLSFPGNAQTDSSKRSVGDSVNFTGTLSTIVISAFEQDKKLSDQPSPIFYLNGPVLNRFSHTNILSAVNTIPGVNMQQRSPQSYRLDIRGSALRSPFGVRNVKIYYNGIPLTDPGGNTYLNELGFDDIHDLTIIKGPAGSIYGAGIGGVVLINSPLFSNDSTLKDNVEVNLEGGSYGLRKIGAAIRWDHNEFRYADTRSDGYRDQTAMHSRVAAYETILKDDSRQRLSLSAHYTDLFYQTPGALTYDEWKNNPKASRPAAGIYPSAKENKAAVHQKNFLIGAREQYHFDDQVQASVVLYGAYTDFINPTIRNYEFRKEPHFGARLVFQRYQWLKCTKLTVFAGGEFQQGFFNVADHENNKGKPAAMMNDNDINNSSRLVFLQGDLQMPAGWEFTVAASYHSAAINFKQRYPSPFQEFYTNYSRSVSPRIAFSKKLPHGKLIYLNVSSGFSPPTVAELLPSTSVINTHLQAESGLSYDVGSRGFLFGQKLYYDVDAFVFNLKHSIALRRDSSGADYFVNAGGTKQHGAELYLAYPLVKTHQLRFNAWTSASWFDFSYRNYQVEEKNYSGKSLPGVSPFSFSAGLDMEIASLFKCHVMYRYGHKVPLNDANDVYSTPYHLMDVSLNYTWPMSHNKIIELFGGVNNVFNQIYSLGDDINAVGGRYFNTAPRINFYVGVVLKYLM